MPELVKNGRWGIRQQLSDERWGGGTVGLGYRRKSDAQADVERMQTFGYTAEVYDRENFCG